ncbi:MAG: SDR family NAD(P)-dependent oxidoreductase [Paracoccus sp. (in: a-proteobacteria)]
MSYELNGRHLFLFGPGYTGHEVALRVLAAGGSVSATARSGEKAETLQGAGITPWIPDQDGNLPSDAFSGVTDLLISAPPAATGCPAYAALSALPPENDLFGKLGWVGYYSSSAVYGNCDGAWIDETQPPAPVGTDAKARLIAEDQWHNFAASRETALDIFRIAGIYGPGTRNILTQLRAGTARAIIKPGQVFNRIHRDDIVAATLAAMSAAGGIRLTNLADGNPCPSSEIALGLARVLDLPPPPKIAFDDAALPPAAAGFYAENRRLRNDALCNLPGFSLQYPDWHAGYAAIIAQEP